MLRNIGKRRQHWVWGAALTTLFTIIVGSYPTMPTLAARVSRPIAGRGE